MNDYSWLILFGVFVLIPGWTAYLKGHRGVDLLIAFLLAILFWPAALFWALRKPASQKPEYVEPPTFLE
jgi:hypothetical protein